MAVVIVCLGLRLAIYGQVDWHTLIGIFVAIVGLVTVGLGAALRLRIWMRLRRTDSPNA